MILNLCSNGIFLEWAVDDLHSPNTNDDKKTVYFFSRLGNWAINSVSWIVPNLDPPPILAVEVIKWLNGNAINKDNKSSRFPNLKS